VNCRKYLNRSYYLTRDEAEAYLNKYAKVKTDENDAVPLAVPLSVHILVNL